LFKPAAGIRIRFGTNDPTPWPPELPAGENPPPGAIIDYYLPAAAGGAVKLEFLDSRGDAIRTYNSADPVRSPDPATDPAAYNKICQQAPATADCDLPLYWPAPPQILKNTAGMHRFTWDLRYDPIGGGGGRGGADEPGAVPHRTYPEVHSPWVAPGSYLVRLTVNGRSRTQPIAVRLDPRVKITPEVQQIFTLTTQAEDCARNAAAAYKEARDLAEKLRARRPSAANDALIRQVDEIAPAETAGGGGGDRGGAAAPPNLTGIRVRLVTAVQGMQGSEMPPTAAQLQACARQQAAYAALMARWAALKAKVNGRAAPAAGGGAAKQ
jgi:hypothetical protein